MSEEYIEEQEVYEPTEFDLLCQKLIHSNGAYYGYIVVSEDFMDTEIPEGAHWSSYIEGEDVLQKTLWEYVSWEYVSDKKVLISLCALERPTIRQRKVNRQDIGDWYAYLQAYGQDVTKILSSEEKHELYDVEPELYEETT
jgi:hypothetical protein